MQDYFQAAIPEPYRILGLRLKPLSLGRYRLLNRFECAFVAEGEAKAGMNDLILGVLICSMRCDEFLQFLESKEFSKSVRAWGRKITSSPIIGHIPFIGKWWRKNHGFNVIQKIGLFKSYIEQSSKTPAYAQENEETGGPSASHWSQAIEVVLRGELGWTAEEINEQPLSKAMADYFKWAENKGILKLLTEEEMAHGEANALAMMGVQSGS